MCSSVTGKVQNVAGFRCDVTGVLMTAVLRSCGH